MVEEAVAPQAPEGLLHQVRQRNLDAPAAVLGQHALDDVSEEFLDDCRDVLVALSQSLCQL